MRRLLVSLVLSLCVVNSPALADSYPSKSIRMVIPWPAGGFADTLGRVVATELSTALKQTVIVENRGGSNGLIGADAAAKAAPDGYTLMFHSVTSHVINPVLYSKVPYGLDALVPIAVVAAAPLMLVASPNSQVKNMEELTQLARSQPGTLSFASFGSGSASHLAGELFKQQAKVDLLHVPYRGGGPALADTLAGHVPLYFAAFGVARPNVAQGRLKALAVTSSKRVKAMPDVPTMAEAARLPNFEMSVSYAVWAPAKVPPEILQRISTEMNRITASPRFLERLGTEGAEGPITTSVAESISYVQSETARLTTLVKNAGIQLD
jgi:tripartite-type tricarboxylate transporter receptor subunit TctC